MSNLYYFGKLRRTREFIRSFNLTADERLFWDSWFSRCLGDNKLMPFLRGFSSNQRLWIFVIRNDLVFRFGLISLSEDLSGRKYPFLIYKKNNLHDLDFSKTSTTLKFFMQRSIFFSRILTQGYFEDTDYKLFLSENQDAFPEKSQNIIDVLTHGIESEYFISNWLELNTNKYINHTNMLTCSLYNKIFG